MTNEKRFNCVEMKRACAERVREKLVGMSEKEQLAFWRERTEALRRLQSDLRAKRSRQTEADSANGGQS